MRPLAASDLLRAWELGQHRPTWARALLLLASAFPDTPRRQLASLSIGRRNAELFALREATLGPTLNAVARCPGCRQEIEFSVGTRELIAAPPDRWGGPDYQAEIDGFVISARAPTTLDLAAAAECGEVTRARRRLVHRCIRQARRHDADVAIGELPEEVIGAVGDLLDAADPAARIHLALACPACERAWTANFDIAAYFWAELAGQVRRILGEIDSLARAYGWSEAEILAMSPFRRQAYLDLVNG